jgi:hypothetical protein
LILCVSAGALVFFSGMVSGTTHGWEKAGSAAAFLILVALAIRIANLGIFAGPDRLVVRDYFRTYRIRWEEISGFEKPPPHGTFRKSGLRIHLSDGRVISATLYERTGGDSGHAASVAVEELEQLRRQHTGDHGADRQLPTPPPGGKQPE